MPERFVERRMRVMNCLHTEPHIQQLDNTYILKQNIIQMKTGQDIKQFHIYKFFSAFSLQFNNLLNIYS